MSGQFSKLNQIAVNEIRKLRAKAAQKQREVDKLNADADDLQKELDNR